jgi:hypothetical protein
VRASEEVSSDKPFVSGKTKSVRKNWPSIITEKKIKGYCRLLTQSSDKRPLYGKTVSKDDRAVGDHQGLSASQVIIRLG